MNYWKTDTERMTHWRKEHIRRVRAEVEEKHPSEDPAMPSADIVERVIRECFESEEMRDHLIAHPEVLNAKALSDIITGAMIPLSKKAALMKDVDSISHLDMEEALDALDIKPGQFFELAFETNEIREGNIVHESCHLGPCTSIEKAKRHIRSYYNEVSEGESLWEHRFDENWWFTLNLYEMTDCGELFQLYTYYLIADEICYFDKCLYEDEDGFCFHSDDRYSRGCIDLNVSIPFKKGDVVIIDGRPFCEPKPVLLLDVGDDCCGVWALYKNTDGSAATGAVKHGTVYDAGRAVMLSPLYRLRKYSETHDYDGVKMVLEELGRTIANEDDAEAETEKRITVLGMPVKLFVERNAGKTLAEALGDQHYWYAEQRIECLDLDTPTYTWYRRFVDPPLSYPNGQHITMDELLGLQVSKLWNARNINQNMFVEIVEKSAAWLKKYWEFLDLDQE